MMLAEIDRATKEERAYFSLFLACINLDQVAADRALEGLSDERRDKLVDLVTRNVIRAESMTGDCEITVWVVQNLHRAPEFSSAAIDYVGSIDPEQFHSLFAENIKEKADKRRAKLASVALSMMEKRLSSSEITARVRAENARLKPPLADEQVGRLVLWCAKQHRDRNRPS